MENQYDEEIGVVTEHKTNTKKPPLYRVLLHNDDYTTRDFVVWILETIFHKNETEAVQIMLHVHKRGSGIAGVYTREVAETKMQTVEALANENEYPLRVSIEPDEQE